MVAYLLDQMTICVKDLISMATITMNHDATIDFLELNVSGNLLIFRDTKRTLSLFNMNSHDRVTLLTFCDYVQWVPASDVIVAQDRTKMCVWYNPRAPDQVRKINDSD